MTSIEIDPQKCIGCRICELACSFKHLGEFNPEYSKIRIFFSDDGGLDINIKSCYCAHPFCIDFCPVKAISNVKGKNKKDEIIKERLL